MKQTNSLNISSAVDNEKILDEIKKLLSDHLGETITFNQFTGIMDRDNKLRFYYRNGLLYRRQKFFKERRGKKNSKEIVIPMDDFVSYLNHLTEKGEMDLPKFKKALVYCIKIGCVG